MVLRRGEMRAPCRENQSVQSACMPIARRKCRRFVNAPITRGVWRAQPAVARWPCVFERPSLESASPLDKRSQRNERILIFIQELSNEETNALTPSPSPGGRGG